MARTFAAAALAIMLAAPALADMNDSMKRLETELVAKYGEAQRPRLQRGMKQVAQFWRAEDGDEAAFEDVVRTHFAGDATTLDALFDRMQFILESVGGHMTEIGRDFRWQSDLDLGPIYPFDEILAAYDPSAHVNDDLFENKLAFVVLLNFPLTTLEQRLTEGETWTRRQWAEAALGLTFSKRIPAEVNQAVAKASADTSQYIADYNIWMHHVVDDKGKRLFPAKMRLLEHWNLRDEIKGDYGTIRRWLAEAAHDPARHGAHRRSDDSRRRRRQPARRLESLHERSEGDDGRRLRGRRPSRAGNRHEHARARHALRADPLRRSCASKLVDPYSPTAPTHIAPPLRRRTADPGGARQGDAGGGRLLAARAAHRRS